MRDEAQYLLGTTMELTKEQFLADETLKRAVVRSLEIIGEAAKQIPDDYRQAHPEVPWQAICGMRDRLIHGYLTVNYTVVWDTVAVKVPELKDQLLRLISQLPD